LAGTIKLSYGGSPLTLTATNLQSLASSSGLTAGWTSAWIDNTTTLALDYLISGQITAGTTPTAGTVAVYAYAQHSDGSTAPAVNSAGTAGTEGAFTITDTEQLNASLVLLWSSDVDTTTNDVYTMPPRSIAGAFGQVPRKFALFAAHSTVAALKSSGNAFYADPILQQYT
jgi:hypothetical protein